MELIDVKALAQKLQCCPRTIDRAGKEGGLLPCSLAPLLFDKRDVLEFLNKCRKGMAAQLAEIPEDFITTVETADALKIKPNALRAWLRKCDKNNLPHFRLSKTWVLFRMVDVENWFMNRKEIIRRMKCPETRAERIKKAKDYYRNIRLAAKQKRAAKKG